MEIKEAKVETIYRHKKQVNFLRKEKTGKARVLKMKTWHRT